MSDKSNFLRLLYGKRSYPKEVELPDARVKIIETEESRVVILSVPKRNGSIRKVW